MDIPLLWLTLLSETKKRLCPPDQLCAQCLKTVTLTDQFQLRKKALLEHTGHVLMSLNTDKKAEYKCGTCNSVKTTTIQNLMKASSTKFCSSCINKNTTKKTFDDVIVSFEQLKLANQDLAEYAVIEYKDNKNVTFKCEEGHCFETTYFDVKRGRRCPECAPKHRTETNLAKYGASNVFASEQIKKKIKETCLQKYGETHHMKVSTIREKAAATNLARLGVRFAFHTDKSFAKIRATCIKRYGAGFPLQSRYIQSKISLKWLEKIGATRPMANQEYWKTCMDKYGVDHYFKSKHCKEVCMNKYGVDHYSKTDQFKVDYVKTCMDRYGVEHPMKTVEVFSRAMASGFRRKEFVFPSGRVDLVQGYEPLALAELVKTYRETDIITNIWCIPTFEYERVITLFRPKCQKLKMSTYFPDILLPDKIIEIKSVYTYNGDEANTVRKMHAHTRAGYVAELWVYRDEKHIETKTRFSMEGEEVHLFFNREERSE